MIDFIGDIHGHAEKLAVLLEKLGYRVKNGAYRHTERTAVFVGDYIDRGPEIRKTLDIVRRMVDAGTSIALMGNHEYNAICFHYSEKEGGHLRQHKIKNILQHYQTLLQFQNRQEEYDGWIEWCKSLPLFHETATYRAVHACWDHENILFLKRTLANNRLTEELIYQSVKKETQLHSAIENTLKGKEILLPGDGSFIDKDGTSRQEIRIKWWDDPGSATYRSISVEPQKNLPDLPLAKGSITGKHYGKTEPPVFFGHYWLRRRPQLYRNNICCLDYSVAKEGYLAAYRWDGERELSNDKWVYV
jgi:hypothetical protein